MSIKDCYIGHTTDFTKRKNSHKTNCNDEHNASFHLRVYSFIREHGGWANWSMIPIEEMMCENRFEALRRERELIETNNCTLNFQIPTRTYAEWRQVHAEKIAENKGRIAICSICGGSATRTHLPRHQKSIKCQSFINQ